jgi:hypothetical protein
MSIDRIGKGGAPPAPKPAVSGPSLAEKTGAARARGVEEPKPFVLHPETTVGTPATLAAPGTTNVSPTAPAGASPLEKLRTGEVDLEGYLDLKVHEAVGHLKGLRPAELSEIRATLREHMAQDPGLAELVRRATGESLVAKE